MKRKVSVVVITVLVLMLGCMSVSAASGDSTLYVSSSSLEVGDSLTVTVTVSASKGYIFGLEGSLSYNPDVLKFISGDSANGSGGTVFIVNVADSEKQESMSFDIEFEAISNGDSDLAFSTSSTYTPDLEEFSTSGCSTSISVSKPAPPQEPEEPEDEPEEPAEEPEDEPEEEPVDEPEVPEEEPEEVPEEKIIANIDGVEYKIWQDYEGVELPNGYGPYFFNYKAHQSLGAVDGSGRIVLAYLENVKTKEKGFFVYANETFVPYVPVKAVASSYVLYPLDEGVKIPVIFDEKIDNYRKGSLPVWASSDPRLEGIVLIYATGPNGVKGLYLYEEETATVQKFIQINYEDPVQNEPVAPQEPIDKAQSLYARILEDKDIFTIVAVLSALVFALIIACIFAITSKKVTKVDKKKFEKKMGKKQARFEKRANRKNKPQKVEEEFTIETENFDEMTEEQELNEEENTPV